MTPPPTPPTPPEPPAGSPSTHASILDALHEMPIPTPAWERFQRRYEPAIADWCRARGLQHACALDVTQEVLIKLFARMPLYQHDPERGRFRHWLTRVVKNTLVDYLRRRDRQLDAAIVGGPEALDSLQSDAAVDDLSMHLEQAATSAVEACLKRVRRDFEDTTWRAFEAVTLHQRPVEAVARELGLTIPAIYAAKYRVMKALRQTFQEEGEGA